MITLISSPFGRVKDIRYLKKQNTRHFWRGKYLYRQLTCKRTLGKTYERTLEKVRSGTGISYFFTPERTFSNVRSRPKNIYTIFDLMQSIKGNFSRMVHQDHIWQRRFNTRIVNTDEYLATIIYYIKIIPLKIIYRKNFDKSRINILMGIKLKVFSRRFLACFIDS